MEEQLKDIFLRTQSHFCSGAASVGLPRDGYDVTKLFLASLPRRLGTGVDAAVH